MFTPDDRERLRSELLDRARADRRIASAALTGSAAADREDCWSDIDLAFAVGDASELPVVLSDWTERMYAQHRALHHLDVTFGSWIYRVFILSNSLQVDLAFVPAADFRALSPTFRLVFGPTNEPREFPSPEIETVIGFGWLYALHARACIAREKLWQAEYMISGIRDNALTLACIRHGLSAVHGKGLDLLPSEVSAPFEHALVAKMNPAELARAFEAAVHGFLNELSHADPILADRLQGALRGLVQPLDQ